MVHNLALDMRTPMDSPLLDHEGMAPARGAEDQLSKTVSPFSCTEQAIDPCSVDPAPFYLARVEPSRNGSKVKVELKSPIYNYSHGSYHLSLLFVAKVLRL